MMLRDVRFGFFVSLLIFIAPIFAQNKDAKKWFIDDEVSTPDTETHFRNRRTVNGTSSAPYFQRTTRYSIPPPVEVSTQKTRVPSPTNTPTYNFTEDVAHNLTSDLKNFGKYITSNGSSEEENEVNDEYIYDFASVLMFEIFAMATGNHLVIPPNEDGKLEEKQQECAWAVAQLRLNLCYAENVVDILIKVIEETVTQYNSTGKLQAVKNMQEVLRTLFNKLNDTIEHNDFLSSKYKEERIRYLARHSHNADTRHKVYLSLDNVTRGEIDRRALIAFVNDVDIRKCFMHGQFISIMRTEFSLMEFAHLFRNEGDKNRIMRAYITTKVANEERCVSQMQNLYTAAWNETVKNFDAAVRMERNVWFLLDKLSKSVEADSVLKNKWTKQENDVREKLREKQTLR